MNRVGKISDFGLKKSNGFWRWAGHPPNSSGSIRHAQEKIMIIPALTKLVQSWWLNIGFFFCAFMDLEFVLVHKQAKREIC